MPIRFTPVNINAIATATVLRENVGKMATR